MGKEKSGRVLRRLQGAVIGYSAMTPRQSSSSSVLDVLRLVRLGDDIGSDLGKGHPAREPAFDLRAAIGAREAIADHLLLVLLFPRYGSASAKRDAIRSGKSKARSKT